jgi:eukaryotic-like serine/threonine-protein kinase
MVDDEELDPMIGRHFGGATVVRLIGRGGMGAVYEAENPLLGKRYAVKVVLPELAENPTAVGQFLQEARSASLAEHPRIVPILDCGYTDDGRPFQAMPFLSGSDLDSYCEVVGAQEGHADRLETATAAPLFFQILDGLATAHDRRILHRDLKGANIQVLTDRTIKILNFGIAKLFDAVGRVVTTSSLHIVGTPGYMSPEQARGGPVDYRADLWALGARVLC